MRNSVLEPRFWEDPDAKGASTKPAFGKAADVCFWRIPVVAGIMAERRRADVPEDRVRCGQPPFEAQDWCYWGMSFHEAHDCGFTACRSGWMLKGQNRRRIAAGV